MQVEYDGKTAGPTQVESKISVPVEMDGSGNETGVLQSMLKVERRGRILLTRRVFCRMSNNIHNKIGVLLGINIISFSNLKPFYDQRP